MYIFENTRIVEFATHLMGLHERHIFEHFSSHTSIETTFRCDSGKNKWNHTLFTTVALLLPVANVLLGSLHNDNRDFKIGFCLTASIEFPSCLRSTLTGLDEMVFKLR